MSFNPSQSFQFWRLLISGVAVVLLAAGWLFTSVQSDTQETISASSYYSGRKPDSDWVSVNGKLLWDQAAYEGTDYFGTWYVPLVTSTWQHGNTVKLIVRVNSAAAEGWGENETVDGMLEKRMPEVVETFFKAEGPQLAEKVMLLRSGAEPGTGKRFAHILIVFGLLAIGGSLLLYDSDPHDPSKGTPLMARPRTLGPRPSDLKELTGEIGPDDPAVQAREGEVQRWMREHGLPADEPAPAEETEPDRELV